MHTMMDQLELLGIDDTRAQWLMAAIGSGESFTINGMPGISWKVDSFQHEIIAQDSIHYARFYLSIVGAEWDGVSHNLIEDGISGNAAITFRFFSREAE